MALKIYILSIIIFMFAGIIIVGGYPKYAALWLFSLVIWVGAWIIIGTIKYVNQTRIK